MINDGINNVPDKTIAVFIDPEKDNTKLTNERVLGLVKKSPKKRNWFSPAFYRCLPLTIGNQYGFTITTEFDFSFVWNGGDSVNDLSITLDDKALDDIDILYPNVSSHFGSGIITINPPFFLRTPPGINLMTINPPNFVIPNITVMTGVIETDNLRRNFTFNLKVQIPNIKVDVPAGSPLAAFIPVPRYFCDRFEMKFAEELFSKEIIDEELEASNQANIHRATIEPELKNHAGRHYFLGKDVYGNEFKDHQKK